MKRGHVTRLAFLSLLPAMECGASEDETAGAIRTSFHQEVAFGATFRVKSRDPGLIGGGNGGTGYSVNYDDGNLNYGGGATALGVQGRSLVESRWNALELKLEAVYFYDFVNADGQTEFHPLSEAARDRAGRALYLNEAYVGVAESVHGLQVGARVGNQILRWSESPWFGHSLAPVNPVSGSRRYQPGNAAKDASIALPMLTASLESTDHWRLQGFYQLAFEPTELEAAGTFLSGNDYYSPGGRYIQLGQGSPLVPDRDASVVTPATPFGSRVSRDPDRMPGGSGQFGGRIAPPPLGWAQLALAGYAMRVHGREPIVSIRTGTLGGLLGITAPDYTSSGGYFVEHVPNVTVVGGSARFAPAAYSRVGIDYSMRLRQPLQIDDDTLITAGLAPAAAVAACAPNPASAVCLGTLAALNRNPVIASLGGITAANAARLFATEISGYERYNVSQYAISLGQGLPPVLGAKQWSLAAEAGGIHIHGFRDRFLDASVSIRPDAAGARRLGFATRSSWGYRVTTRLDYANWMGAQKLSPSLTWIHDPKGNAPITLGTLLQGTKGVIAGVDCAFDKSLTARLSYRSYVNKGDDADRFSDRDFISLSFSRAF